MKGRIAILDHLNGREAAALMVDGRLTDLLIDPKPSAIPLPGAIYRGIAERPLKGQGGLIIGLGDGQKGYLRNAREISPGTVMLVQIAANAERGKAPPVTTRLLFKGRNAILTPDAPGRNIARSVRDDEARERMAEIAAEAMADAPDTYGLILRSAATAATPEAILAEISELRDICCSVLENTDIQGPGILLQAPGAHFRAWRDWTDPEPDQVADHDGSFAEHDLTVMIETLETPMVRLGALAKMFVEPTRALVAVDVNTGGDFSPAAGLKANIAAARDLPRQLRLRGLGGQIVIDFAPMGKKDRRQVEQVLKQALRRDSVDTVIVGWSPLGHLELQRKRERMPLADVFA